jgi:branched-subunit amino acid ABC-type transport system permease component
MIGVEAACILAVVTAVVWRLLAGRPSADLQEMVASIGRRSSREPGALR